MISRNEKKKILFDPLEANIYKLPPWLIIGEDDVPQFSDTHKYLLYTQMFKYPHSRASQSEIDSFRRKLEGEASILHWKMNDYQKIIVDKFSLLTVGVFSHHMLCVNRRDDIKLNWYLNEYRSTRTGLWTSLCKVRMDNESLKAARSKVKACEKDLQLHLTLKMVREQVLQVWEEKSDLIDNYKSI